MNIQFEGIRQFTPCMIFTSIDANVFRIVLAAMNFAFANFIDRRQQGIDIDADLTFCGIAVLFLRFSSSFLATVTLLLPPVVKSAWHHLSIDRRENQHSRAPGAARKTKLFYTGTKAQEENDEGE